VLASLIKAAEDESVLHVPGIPDGPFGLHAQQAAEKMLKGLISQLGVAIDYTHVVTKFAAQLAQLG
jgi:hypothetical protein